MSHCNNFKHNNKEQFNEYIRVKECFKDKPNSYYSGYCRAFVKNNVSDLWVERIRRLHKDKSKVTKYRLFLLHGKDNYLKVFQDYCSKQSIKNTFEYKQKKYGWTKEQFDNYNQKRAVTLDNFIIRYGEYEGTKKFDEYIQKKNYSSSHLADELFNYIYENIDTEDKSHVYFLKLNTEFGKYDKELKKYYKYDFVLTNKKICIEFNGDYWHANPLLYKPNDIIRLKGGSKKAVEIWVNDSRKKKIIEKDGYKVYYIWEIDYRETPELVKERILNEIRNC